ncbi:hypothetical protein [Paenibacillus sp. FSL H3-0333]
MGVGVRLKNKKSHHSSYDIITGVIFWAEYFSVTISDSLKTSQKHP